MNSPNRSRPSPARSQFICHALVAGALCLAAIGVRAEDGRKHLLTDAELDSVTAGNAAVRQGEETIVFEAVKETAAGHTIRADGKLEIIEVPIGIAVGNLTLSDGAQQNLQSMINVNAVNSAINVLLNLNITIDSSVGAINQLNATAPLAQAPPVPLVR